MNKEKIQGLVRHILTFGGGWAVAKGYIDEAMMLQIAGAGATVAGFVWSIFFAPEKQT